MGLFDRLSGKGKKTAAESATSALGAYSGMRVEVLDEEHNLLFTAKLSVTAGGQCRLQQQSETDLPTDGEPLPIQLRGYDETQKLAVHMSGLLSWVDDQLWQVDKARVESKSNDRAFFRQGVDVVGDIRPVGKGGGEKSPCHVVNISAGGACVQTAADLPVDSMCILNFRLAADVTLPPLPSEIRRKSKCRAGYEYGCKFLDLNAITEDQIAKAIMRIQMEKRRR